MFPSVFQKGVDATFSLYKDVVVVVVVVFAVFYRHMFSPGSLSLVASVVVVAVVVGVVG